jgi:hypothetical protein
MSHRYTYPLAAVLALAALSIPSSSPAGPWLPQPGDYYSELSGTIFPHDARSFDDGGNDLEGSPRIGRETREINTYNELGWKPRVSFVLGIPLVSVTHRTDSPYQTSTQTGLGDVLVGARFKVLEGSNAVAVETDWEIPMGYERDVNPALGEGLHRFSAALQGGAVIEPMNGFAQGSLRYLTRVDIHTNPMKDTRNVGSNELHWDGDVAGWVGQVLLAARYTGFSASASDLEVDRNLQSVGPEVRYRVDDRLDVITGARFDFAGRNVEKTSAYYLGIVFKQTRLDRLQGFLGGARRP